MTTQADALGAAFLHDQIAALLDDSEVPRCEEKENTDGYAREAVALASVSRHECVITLSHSPEVIMIGTHDTGCDEHVWWEIHGLSDGDQEREADFLRHLQEYAETYKNLRRALAPD